MLRILRKGLPTSCRCKIPSWSPFSSCQNSFGPVDSLLHHLGKASCYLTIVWLCHSASSVTFSLCLTISTNFTALPNWEIVSSYISYVAFKSSSWLNHMPNRKPALCQLYWIYNFKEIEQLENKATCCGRHREMESQVGRRCLFGPIWNGFGSLKDNAISIASTTKAESVSSTTSVF